MKQLFLVSFLLLCHSAFADKPGFGDTFVLSLGVMDHGGKADLSSTNVGDAESVIDLDELGLDDDQRVVWTSGRWRFTDRWELGASYTNFNTKGSASASRDYSYGDLDVTASATVASDLDIELYIVDVTWDLLSTDRSQLGVGLGLHVMDMGLSLSAELDLGTGAPVQTGSETGDATAPLPNFTLVGGHMLTDKLYLTAKAGVFSLDYDKYSGKLTSLRGMLEWRPKKNVGIGVGYQYVDVDVKVDGDLRERKYTLELDGPILFLTVGF